jgi:CspA family cold shock protein
MKNGIVKWFNSNKGFGFIQCENKDYFVHFKDIKKEGYKELKQDERVSFIPGKSPKGDVATEVTSI